MVIKAFSELGFLAKHVQLLGFKKAQVFLIFIFVFCLQTFEGNGQALGVTSPAATGTYCAGANVNVTYTASGTFSNTPSPNVFSIQVSDASGGFGGSPVTIGVATSTVGGTIACTFPSTLVTSNLYRVRVISSNPATLGSDNGANLTFFAIDIDAPTFTGTSFCRGEAFVVNFTQSSCPFVNVPSANVYSVELSNSSGSFASPTIIGTLAATVPAPITCVIPLAQAAGTNYRIRMASSRPALKSPNNGTNLSIVAPAGNPALYGTTNWLVHCFETRDDYSTNYKGFYTETSLSFNTTTRWTNTSSPSSANSTGGNAYSGCSVSTGTYSFSYKRTNIACGYYRVDIPQHRNEVYMLINGAIVFQHTTCCDAHTGAWQGVIQNTDSVEFRSSRLATQGFLQVTFTKLNEQLVSPAIRVCSGSNASLTAINTGTLPVTYSWTPSATVSNPTIAATVANPIVSTTYSASAYSGTCAVFVNAIAVTVGAAPSPGTSVSSATICNGQTVSTMTATGGQTYTWAPAAGLSTTSGYTTIASPTITTTYTLFANNNCSTSSTTRNIIVQNIPASPTPTAFGNNVWNVFCYNTNAFTSQYGYYTENNLSFATTSRWSITTMPSNANASSGLAYQGCIIGANNHSLIHKRTNFTCGYYQIDLNHDESINLLIDGVSVFSHATANHIDLAAWTGFLGPSSTVEIRQVETSGNSSLTVAFSNVVFPDMSPPVTICAGTPATLTAASASGLTYSWTPATYLGSTTGPQVISNALANIIYTCTVTETVTGCTSSNTLAVTVNPLPSTAASPLSSTINCAAEQSTLIATGANTYTWSPAISLNTSTGYSVIASPTVNTVYTVTGNNNCATIGATVAVNVVPLVNPTVFPSGTWNAYCYANTTFGNYYGYYTEVGNGTSGYDFNTTNRWAATALPSNADNSNGLPYSGCTMPSSNWSIIYKRTNFACNAYSLQVNGNDNNVTIFINGVQVATRASSTNTVPLWYGVLTNTSTVEIRHTQTTGTASLDVVFVPAASSSIVWLGGTSTNWFTTNNWCGGSLPTASDDVIIPAGGSTFKPSITSNSGAQCHNLTILPAVTANSTLSAIGTASLSFTGSFNLDVYGDWINYGTFVQSTGTVRFLGTATQSIISSATQTFYNLEINNADTVSVSSGIQRISNNINFISGIVVTSGTFQILNGATSTGANDLSYVEGVVTKFGNQAFSFPVGGSGFHRPISISAPVLATDNFTAKYFNTDPSASFTHTAKDVSIDHIGRCEYWTLDRSGGTSVVFVTLSWNATSCGVTNIADLLVARWDAGQVKWKDHGNGATTGNTTSGTVISSAPITGFSPFTLGSKTFLNPLPIELKDFTSSCTKDSVILHWTTLNEKQNLKFSIETSQDAVKWSEVGSIAASNNSNGSSYSISQARTSNKSYFRLGQTDQNGKKKFFPIIEDGCSTMYKNDFSIFPNPTEHELVLEIDLENTSASASLEIRNSTGQLLSKESLYVNAGRTIINKRVDLPPGLYFFSLLTAETVAPITKKVLIK